MTYSTAHETAQCYVPAWMGVYAPRPFIAKNYMLVKLISLQEKTTLANIKYLRTQNNYALYLTIGWTVQAPECADGLKGS